MNARRSPDAGTLARRRLASETTLAPEAQGLLAADADENVRSILADRDDLVLEVQVMLARDADEYVRRRLAGNPGLAQSLALVLADDVSRVRHVLAHNEAITLGEAFPLACLEESARGRSIITRAMAAHDLDLEEVAVLREGWVGTLEELLETAREIAAHEA
jgi:hypothetical protein